MIDDKDKLILFELLQDSRKPVSRIAKEVNLPENTVNYRINKLIKKGVIKKFTVNINSQKLGYNRHSLYLDLKSISPMEIDEYLKIITNIDEVSCCYLLHELSDWKIYISVWTKNINRYDEIQALIMKKFNKYIYDYISFQSVRSYTYFARRLNLKKIAKCDIKEETTNFKLINTDRRIIDILKENSRLSLLHISQRLKMHVDTVKKRIKFLQENNIIQRCYPILDIKKIGYREYTFISRLNPSGEEAIEKFIKWARADPRFVIIIKAVGWVNLYYAFHAMNNDEFQEITSKIEQKIGKYTLKTYRIEVDQMIN